MQDEDVDSVILNSAVQDQTHSKLVSNSITKFETFTTTKKDQNEDSKKVQVFILKLNISI